MHSGCIYIVRELFQCLTNHQLHGLNNMVIADKHSHFVRRAGKRLKDNLERLIYTDDSNWKRQYCGYRLFICHWSNVARPRNINTKILFWHDENRSTHLISLSHWRLFHMPRWAWLGTGGGKRQQSVSGNGLDHSTVRASIWPECPSSGAEVYEAMCSGETQRQISIHFTPQW